MASKKKTSKKRVKATKTRSKRVALKKNKKLAKKKNPKTKATRKKALVKAKAVRKKTTTTHAPAKPKKPARGKTREADAGAFSFEEPVSRAGRQSGDLQGLSNLERADSESVDELLEEGNAFEADAVLGVQEAGDAEGREVRTREVPEDDVPGEYLDED